MRGSIGRNDGKVVSGMLSDGDQPLIALAQLASDSLQEAEAVVNGEAESLILYRDNADGVRAWRNVCPHAGRRLDYAPGQFLRTKTGQLVCAVHGATFALPEGNCVAGPCKGDCLCAVDVHSRDGQVWLGPAPDQ